MNLVGCEWVDDKWLGGLVVNGWVGGEWVGWW